MERLRVATGMELFAHKRLAGFVLCGGAVSSGETYSAGDVLAAVAFASEGTVRQMPTAKNDDAPLYVLTRDIEPVGRQVERIGDWLEISRKPGNDAADDAVKKIAASNPLPRIRFDGDDAFAFPEGWRDRLTAASRTDGDAGYIGFALRQTELSADQQKMVSAAISSRNESARARIEDGGDSRVSGAKLFASAMLRSLYKVPGEPFLSGEIGGNYLGTYGNWLPPMPPTPDSAPVTTAKRARLLSADTEAAARQAVGFAKLAEASALWLRAGTPAILSATTLEAGSELPVLAVITIQDAVNAPANLPRDVSLFGQPSDTPLAPDDPAVIAWAANRMLYLAAVPNLAGIVCESVLPDDYRGADTDRYSGGNGWTGGNDETGWGYKNAARRRFLREHGADPADLTPSYNELSEAESETAAFGTDELLTKEWDNARRDSVSALLTAARNAAGEMPVHLAGETQFEGKGGELDRALFFVPWKGADKPPVNGLFRGTWSKIPTVPDAKTGTFIAVVSPHTGLAGTELLARTKRTDTSTLTVVDWSHRPLAEIEAELSAKPPKP